MERTGKDIGRRNAKDVNLGSDYGMGKGKLARKLKISIEAADALLKARNAGVPYAKQLERLCMDKAIERGYIFTILKRKRRFLLWEPVNSTGLSLEDLKPIRDHDEAIKKWGAIRRAYCHKALNARVQGSAGDQMKQALVDLDDADLLPQLQVYDEVDGSYESVEDAIRAKKIMENAIPMTVPFLVEPEIGTSWGATTKI
jgi:DNA polymerase I